MKIKKFEDFIFERNYRSYGDHSDGLFKGKLSAFKPRERSSHLGKWLEGVKSRLNVQSSSSGDGGNKRWGDPFKVLGLLGGVAANIGAGVSDALFGKVEKPEDYKKKSKEELEKWERDTFSDKRKTEKDAEAFYASGVSKGKKIFGDDFDPDNPKTEWEKSYSEDLYDSTERYYNRTKKRPSR